MFYPLGKKSRKTLGGGVASPPPSPLVRPTAREDKAQRTNPPYRPYTHCNPSKDIFKSYPRSFVSKRVNFTNVDSWALSHAMLRDVRESNCKLQP